MDPIAIVGLACHLPQARNPDEYWEILRAGRDTITLVPPDRWSNDDYYEPGKPKRGKIVSPNGGFIEKVDEFDPAFFGITARQAESIDPQQRLFLETAWEALENAAIPPGSLADSLTGVFVGVSNYDYGRMMSAEPRLINAHSGIGTIQCMIANRLSYFLNLKGPSFAVDTACSSSLLSVHLACQSLQQRECDLAIAGGVNLMLSPQVSVGFSLSGMMSPDGRCKTFDARADGYGRSEGAGVVILKRLEDALRNHDAIFAVIRGTAANHNGASNGITAPNGPAQEQLIQTALRRAGVAPDDIGYIEAHGTGTLLGDAAEFYALKKIFGARPPALPRLWVGACKANLGHLESGAGIAGLLKAILVLDREAIPPQVNFRDLNPNIVLDGAAIGIPTTLIPWPRGAKPRHAGVSAFGIGGANVHLVLAGAPERRVESAGTLPLVLTISAPSESGLRALARRYASFLEAQPETAMPDICRTSNIGRNHFRHRYAVAPANRADLIDDLRRVGEAQPPVTGWIGKADLAAASSTALRCSTEVAQQMLEWGLQLSLVVTGGLAEEFLAEAERSGCSTAVFVASPTPATVVANFAVWEFSRQPTVARTLAAPLARFYVLGVPIAWTRIGPRAATTLPTLPNYPFDKRRYWMVAPNSAENQPTG